MQFVQLIFAVVAIAISITAAPMIANRGVTDVAWPTTSSNAAIPYKNHVAAGGSYPAAEINQREAKKIGPTFSDETSEQDPAFAEINACFAEYKEWERSVQEIRQRNAGVISTQPGMISEAEPDAPECLNFSPRFRELGSDPQNMDARRLKKFKNTRYYGYEKSDFAAECLCCKGSCDDGNIGCDLAQGCKCCDGMVNCVTKWQCCQEDAGCVTAAYHTECLGFWKSMSCSLFDCPKLCPQRGGACDGGVCRED